MHGIYSIPEQLQIYKSNNPISKVIFYVLNELVNPQQQFLYFRLVQPCADCLVYSY